MNKITQLAEQGKDNARGKSRAFEIAIDLAQAPLIEYCKELEEELDFKKRIKTSDDLMASNQTIIINKLEKENQELKEKIVDFVLKFNKEWHNGNPLSPIEIAILLSTNKDLRDSDGNKPSDDRLEDFGANPISSENKTLSGRRKKVCICGHSRHNQYGCLNRHCVCRKFKEVKK